MIFTPVYNDIQSVSNLGGRSLTPRNLLNEKPSKQSNTNEISSIIQIAWDFALKQDGVRHFAD